MQRGRLRESEASDEYLPEPDPDYISDEESNDSTRDDSSFPVSPVLTPEELSVALSKAYSLHVRNGMSQSLDTGSSNDTGSQLIRPKRLFNPQSKEHQALHRELLLNHKIGKDILHKPELDKVLRERKEKERRKELDEHSFLQTSLEMKLKERADRIQEEENKKVRENSEENQSPELTRVYRRITLRPSNATQHTHAGEPVGIPLN